MHSCDFRCKWYVRYINHFGNTINPTNTLHYTYTCTNTLTRMHAIVVPFIIAELCFVQACWWIIDGERRPPAPRSAIWYNPIVRSMSLFHSNWPGIIPNSWFVVLAGIRTQLYIVRMLRGWCVTSRRVQMQNIRFYARRGGTSHHWCVVWAQIFSLQFNQNMHVLGCICQRAAREGLKRASLFELDLLIAY